MFLKKHFLLALFTTMSAFGALAQEAGSNTTTPPATTTPTPGAPQWSARDMTYRGKNYDVLDSTYYTKKQLKQWRQYQDHQNPFPPKPRSMYEIGFALGLYNVSADIPSLMFWQKGGGGFSFHARKSWGYAFSTRLQYIYGVGKNLDVQPTQSFDAPYTKLGYVPRYYATSSNPATDVYRATRTEASQLTLDLIFNVGNISFHNERNKLSYYGYVGIGGLAYKTLVNATNAAEVAYNFGATGNNALNIDPKATNKDVRKSLQSKMDKTYDVAAENGNANKILDDKALTFAPSFGFGVQYRINKQFNIQIEDRYTFTNDDYLDGTRFGPSIGNAVSVSQGSDGVNYLSVGINYNLKVNSKKAVEPLNWINPLDHSYSELSYPRHMLLPPPVLPDEDNDGITDQFDKCPKTPVSVAVDGKGCPMDTDGDGVPDYKDKQLITPTECQPVDADGVGHCPCPEACKGVLGGGNGTSNPNCPHIMDGTIRFKNSGKMSDDIKTQLATLAAQMKLDVNCKVVVVGGGGDKRKEQHAWELVNAVIEYMTDNQSILRDRFIFQYGKGDDENVVNYRAAGEEESGPNSVPPPHPNLK